MTKPANLHGAEGTIYGAPGVGILSVYGNGAPADGLVGYAKGCLYHDVTGGKAYCNVGTVDSAAWKHAFDTDQMDLYLNGSVKKYWLDLGTGLHLNSAPLSGTSLANTFYLANGSNGAVILATATIDNTTDVAIAKFHFSVPPTLMPDSTIAAQVVCRIDGNKNYINANCSYIGLTILKQSNGDVVTYTSTPVNTDQISNSQFADVDFDNFSNVFSGGYIPSPSDNLLFKLESNMHAGVGANAVVKIAGISVLCKTRD